MKRPGVKILVDVPGSGVPVELHAHYEVRLRIWLSRGDQVRWRATSIPFDSSRVEDEGTSLLTTLHVHRASVFPGLFYGVEGMRVGGTRRIRVAPHLGYGAAGVPGVIPPNALLIVEITIVAAR